MPAPHASLFVTAGIVLLSLAWLVAWPLLVAHAAPSAERRSLALRFAGIVGAWALATLGLAATGVFARGLPDKPSPFMAIPAVLIVGVMLIARSRIGSALVETPLWMLVLMQGFRLPLELVMHAAAQEGTMPPQMTFGVVDGVMGCNYDVVTGATALALGFAIRFASVPRALVLAWNILGSVLLLAIVAIALTSTPLIAAFGRDPNRLNVWVFHAPFVWLPAVLVGSALLGHVLVFKSLLRARAFASREDTAPARG